MDKEMFKLHAPAEPGLRKYYADLLLLCYPAQQLDSHMSPKTLFVSKANTKAT